MLLLMLNEPVGFQFIFADAIVEWDVVETKLVEMVFILL